MKRKLYLTAMLLMLAMLSMMAQPKFPQRACDVVKKNFSDRDATSQISRESASQSNATHQYFITGNSVQPQKASSADSVTVILRFNYNTEVHDMSVLMIYNSDWQFYDRELRSYMHQGQHIGGGSFTVPKGTYDIYTVAVNQSFDEPGTYYHIVELADLTQDTTIVIDVTDCENRFVAELKDKNGEPLNTGITAIIDHDPWEEIVEEGTALWLGGMKYLILNGYGVVYSEFTDHPSLPESNDKSSKNCFINTLSDRYQCGVTYYAVGKDREFYANKVVMKGTSSLPLTNDVDDYVYCEEKIKNTPLWKSLIKEVPQGGVFYFEDGLHWGYTQEYVGGCMGFSYLDEDKYGAFSDPKFYLLPDSTFKVYLNIPKQEEGGNRLDMALTLSIPDAKYVHHYEERPVFDDEGNWTGEMEMMPIYATHNITIPEIIGHVDKTLEYLVTNGDCRRSYVNGWDKDYPAHPMFSYTGDQKKGIFGNNCPLITLGVGGMNKTQIGQNQYLVTKFEDVFKGRYGEKVFSGDYYSNLVAKYNDEVIWDGTAKVDSLSQAWLIQEGKTNGVFDLTICNTNVDVDGINGKNVTIIHFDQAKEDWCAPVLTMLQFRDNEGNVTDRFETPDVGVIMFAGGDFDPKFTPYINSHGGESIWDYVECQPMAVEVSYAPYGTDEWVPLDDVEHIFDFDDVPGLGLFYAGSLASVNQTSENGWFDLKFRLVDESGNWQEQTLSPAFRIDALVQSAVTEVKTDHTATDTAIYNLAGQRMHGDLNSLPHGIYIVGGKKVVK